MTNCQPPIVNNIKCISPDKSKCKGTYNNLDLFNKINLKSSLNYNRFPYKCVPETNCLLAGVNLPKIPDQTYNIYSNNYTGFSNIDYTPNKFEINNQCVMK